MELGAIGTQLRIIPVWQQVQNEYSIAVSTKYG